MVILRAHDEHRYVEFSDLYLPPAETLKIVGQNDSEKGDPVSTAINRDKMTARLINSLARRQMRREVRRYGEDLADHLALNTWILGEPFDKSARLAGWFANEPKATNFRVMLHVSARYFLGRLIPPSPWNSAYASRTLKLRHRLGPYRSLIPATQFFLDDVLHGYGHGKTEIEKVFRESGHPYVCAA